MDMHMHMYMSMYSCSTTARQGNASHEACGVLRACSTNVQPAGHRPSPLRPATARRCAPLTLLLCTPRFTDFDFPKNMPAVWDSLFGFAQREHGVPIVLSSMNNGVVDGR